MKESRGVSYRQRINSGFTDEFSSLAESLIHLNKALKIKERKLSQSDLSQENTVINNHKRHINRITSYRLDKLSGATESE